MQAAKVRHLREAKGFRARGRGEERDRMLLRVLEGDVKFGVCGAPRRWRLRGRGICEAGEREKDDGGEKRAHAALRIRAGGRRGHGKALQGGIHFTRVLEL